MFTDDVGLGLIIHQIGLSQSDPSAQLASERLMWHALHAVNVKMLIDRPSGSRDRADYMADCGFVKLSLCVDVVIL